MVLDAGGRPPAGAELAVLPEALGSSPVRVPVDGATGAFRATHLPPGRYRLQARMGARRSRMFGPVALAHGETLDVGVLRVAEPGSLVATVRDADGAMLGGVSIAVAESAGDVVIRWGAGKTRDGVVRVPDLAPGDYRLRADGSDHPTTYQPFTITAGERTTVELRMPAGIACELLLSSVTEPVPIELRFRWTRNGEPFEVYDNRWEGHGERRWRRVLLPGRYELTVESESGQRASTRFALSDTAPPNGPIRIALP